MERRFGHDFSTVRVHHDQAAAEATRAVAAPAFTVGRHIVLGPGAGRALPHELVHAVQQSHAPASPGLAGDRAPLTGPHHPSEREAAAVAGTGGTITHRFVGVQCFPPDAGVQDAGPGAAPSRTADPAATPAELADHVIAWQDYLDPMASGGIGDHAAAYDILSQLDSTTLLAVLVELESRARLDLLLFHIGAAGSDRPRVHAFELAVRYRTAGDLPAADLNLAPGLVGMLSQDDRRILGAHLAPLPGHKQTLFLDGASAERDRLVRLQLQYLEDKRRKAEQAARARAEAEAKAKGKAPPKPEEQPTVSLGDVVESEAKQHALPPIPTAAWDNLPDAAKRKWTGERAPAAFAKVLASIKGTELEQVMKGARLKFEPRKVLERGGYAYQDGTSLVAGMAFVQDAEKDAKNVWPILAHEIGGHLEYGTTYTSTFMNRVRDRLPESERKKWTDTKEGRTRFFDTYLYHETEIFSALRQRRYDVPVSGPAPTHGAATADQIIETRLTTMGAVFAKEVATAVLIELNRKVQASAEILNRDKQHFLARVKKHGYAL